MSAITGLLQALRDISSAGVAWATTPPPPDGVPSAGSSILVARGDHRHGAVDASEIQKGVARLGSAGGAARFEDLERCAKLDEEQTFIERQHITGPEVDTCGYEEVVAGGGILRAGKLLRGYRVRADNGWNGTRAVLAYHDQKTGMQRHRIETWEWGILTASALGPWHPYHEVLPALGGIIEPCGGVTPGQSRTYRHISNALAYSSDEDNQALAPRFLEALVCEEVASASVGVGANAGASWFGSVLPITFRNLGSDPRKFAIQVHSAAGVPEGHKVSLNLGNIPECETGFLWDMPQTFGSIESVQPDGGTITIWLFLGLGRVADAEATAAAAAPYTIQVDAWLQ